MNKEIGPFYDTTVNGTSGFARNYGDLVRVVTLRVSPMKVCSDLLVQKRDNPVAEYETIDSYNTLSNDMAHGSADERAKMEANF